MTDNDSGGRSPADLLRQVHALEDEIAVLRRRVATSPDRVHALEARLSQLQSTPGDTRRRRTSGWSAR